jgi:4-amino-4-deoxy-L-arabinose transferase-like glycosyltransferase
MGLTLFLDLDAIPFRVWDEAYLATHTYEMMHDHDYMVTHSFGAPEMSNTKPPLVIWFMVASCKLFGYSEFSIRLPNVLSGFAICFLIFFFCTNILKSPLKGFLTVLILLSSSGLVRLHVLRSGEYDAILVMFITLYCLSYFLILESEDVARKKQLWIVFTISLILAILAKGVAALMVIPALVCYTISRRKLSSILIQAEFYLSILFIAGISIGYYFLREHYNPGYIQAVRDNELGGRYMNMMIISSPWDYINAMLKDEFRYWLLFAFIGIWAGFRSQDKREKQFTLFCLLIVIVHLLIISIGSTRLAWYDAPIYPFLSLLAGAGVYTLLDRICGLSKNKMTAARSLIIAILIIAITAPGYINVLAHDCAGRKALWNPEQCIIGYIDIWAMHGHSINDLKIVNDKSQTRALICQARKWESEDKHIHVNTSLTTLKVGDTVMIGNENLKSEINKLYVYQTVDTFKNVEVCLITQKK